MNYFQNILVNMFRLSESLHKDFTETVLNSLSKKSIYTSLSFIQTEPEILVKITGLQYSQTIQIKDSLLTKFSSTLRDGNKYYSEILKHCALIPAGIENLDKLLDNGFMTGNIYELCGFSGCGKTQICMTLAINVCSSSQQQVFFIDTKNDISAHRLFEIIEKQKFSNIGEILNKIQICQVRSAYSLLQELHHLKERLEKSKEQFLGFRLVIIDSLSVLFQQFHKQSEGLSLLNSVSNLLKYISSEYHLVILVTNLVTSWTADVVNSDCESEDEEQQTNSQEVQQPALGKYWAHVPNTRITVKRPDGSNECYLIILKSQNHPLGKSTKVKIHDTGVS